MRRSCPQEVLPLDEYAAQQAPEKKPKKEKKGRAPAPPEFRQAAIYCWIVDQLQQRNIAPSRFRVQKMLYFIEDCCGLADTGAQYMQKAAGPYDPAQRYKGAEPIVVKNKYLKVKNGWLFDKATQFAKGLDYVTRGSYLSDEARAIAVIDFFKTYGDEALERWATLHWVADQLAAEGKPATLATVKDYLASRWVGKLEKKWFGDDQIEKTLYGLVREDCPVRLS